MAFSRAIFREYDIRGVAGKDLTEEVATSVGGAYAAFLAQKGVKGAISVGRDNRPSGEGLHRALVAGLVESGVDVVDIGVVPTPLAYWSQHNLDVVGGIQITGSHNPPEYNGFKLGLNKSSIYGTDIQQIYDLAVNGKFPRGKGSLRNEQVIDRYIDDIAERIGTLSRDSAGENRESGGNARESRGPGDNPLKVVIDCGNGAGSLVAPKLFPRLGIKPRFLFCESDGTFPNHHPDPTVPKNLEDLIAAVKKDGADIGIAFDGDADRIGVIDATGEIVWGDYLLIIYARDVLARTGKGQSIVFDIKASQALPEAISKAEGTPVMWKTGHSLIEEKMHNTHAPVAGEMSGHMFFAEGFYGFDDALYGAARLLRIVADSGKGIRELLADVPRFVSTPEIRVDCPDDRKFGIVEDAKKYFGAKYQVLTVDGVRVLFGDGWGLIRASNTQPVIVMRFEARTSEQLEKIQSEMQGWLRSKGVKV
jgi:phosphomannomutase / phosphoglucomutase